MATNYLKKFLRENKQLIINEQFDELYNNAQNSIGFTIGELSDCFLAKDFNPLNKMSSVPSGFMSNSVYTSELFTIPEGNNIEEIGRFAFKNTKIKTFMIREGIKVIETMAFSNSEVLESIYLPSTLEELGNTIFFKSPHIKEIYYNGTYDEFLKIDRHSDDKKDWFKTLAGRTNSTCILICKDQTIQLQDKY